ncbi:ABC transporter I family member 1 [Prunus yedoensis var. nudiflora]|uniref:ABC transporter I family member 1 n=1 Tax=Prunus yedoensis var. nudiflora TaxID=2094558 RepID=A0A314UYX4_PRUYE|nr:ABC transporter I family member 1 [Prunus yedoensis var. nudiflora]
MSLRKAPLPRLLLDNVSCMRNAQQILRHVNASIHDGGALVLMGTNGSGKTTFLRMLAGFSRPSAGQVLWNGHDITDSGQAGEFNASFGADGAWETGKGESKNAVDGAAEKAAARRLLAMDRPIWLLDEPSVALDTEGLKLLEYIIAEHRKKGGIVIVATHQPIEIEMPCT